MPSKRSRSQEREKKRKARLKRSNEEIIADRQRAVEGMKKCRENDLAEIKAYKIIENKHRMRKIRKNLSAEKIKQQKVKSNQGMKDFREKGWLKKYADRGKQSIDELIDWRRYKEKKEIYSKTLEKYKPDIVQQINENSRIEKEKFREIERSRKIKHFQMNERRGLTEEQQNEYSALLRERHVSCMREQKQRDEKVVLALQDEVKHRKLEDYYDREIMLKEDEREEFTKLRMELYKDYKKMNDTRKKVVNKNKQNQLKQKGDKTDMEKKEQSSVVKTKNSKQKKKLKITLA